MVTDNWITPNKKNRFVPQSREKMTSTRALTGAKALAACEASVTLRATNDELARGVDVQMPCWCLAGNRGLLGWLMIVDCGSFPKIRTEHQKVMGSLALGDMGNSRVPLLDAQLQWNTWRKIWRRQTSSKAVYLQYWNTQDLLRPSQNTGCIIPIFHGTWRV